MKRTNKTFEVVSDERRRDANPSSALWNAIRSGKTVLVHNSKLKDFSGSRTFMRKQGYQVYCRQEEDGVIMWADKIE